MVSVLVAGTGCWWYARSRLPPFKVVLQGSSTSSERLGISGGNLVVVAPKPAVFFGTVRMPGSQEQFSYLILFKYGRPTSDGSSRGLEFHCTSSGRTAETKDAIELNGKRIEVAYRIELDETLTAVENESLTLGGNSVDINAGRVFLIDLTAETPVYRQRAVELPELSSKLESTLDVERLADAVQRSLETQDSEIKAFLK